MKKYMQYSKHPSHQEKFSFLDYHLDNKILSQGSKKNLNYLISKSLLHVGIDSMPVHIASAFSKKIVALYSHTYKETCYPYWSSEKDANTLSPDFSEKKPSFSNQEHQKRINEIKPELIAQSILDQLNPIH